MESEGARLCPQQAMSGAIQRPFQHPTDGLAEAQADPPSSFAFPKPPTFTTTTEICAQKHEGNEFMHMAKVMLKLTKHQ